MKPPVLFSTIPAALDVMVPYGRFLAVVDAIHDGDTFSAWIALGFDAYAYHPIRLRGCNAPELTAPDPAERQRAIASRDHLAQLIPLGSVVVLEPERDVMSFERYVAYVYTAPGVEVGARMIADGYAVPMAGVVGQLESVGP